MTFLERPSQRRDPTLWAFAAGAPWDGAWSAWASSGQDVLVTFRRLAPPYQQEEEASYIVEGGALGGCAYLGMYDGYPAWDVGSDGFLFHSKSRAKWVLRRGDIAEPACWTRTVLKADGTTETLVFGDTWHEAASLVPANGKVQLACAGKDEEEARIAGDPAPDPAEIAVPKLWKNAGGGICGEFSPVLGTNASGTRRVGHWSWKVDGVAVFAMDPGDRTRVVDAASGSATACPGGKWTVRTAEGGAWVADLSDAKYESDLTCEWVPVDGAEADGDAPAVEWDGLRAVPTDSFLYVYQPSRFL